MNAIKSIVEWASKDLQAWEGDLVRRLLDKGSVDESDLKQITEYISQTYEIIPKASTVATAPSFVSEDGAKTTGETETITLCAVDNVTNINAIDHNSKLPFSHKGITIFYGENGSGKSGYTRILKNACYAKYVEGEILTNVYKKSITPQSAKITYIHGMTKNEWIWKPGHANQNLVKINVYDAECGKVILEKNNQVTYKPKGAEIFDEVSNAIEKIKDNLTNLTRLATAPDTRGTENNTPIFQWLEKINGNTKKAEVEQHLNWTETHKTSLADLNKKIEEYTSGATTKKIETTNKVIETRLPKCLEKLKTSLTTFSSNADTNIKDLETAHTELEKAHRLAAAIYNHEEPLAGTYSHAWKELYNAAKEYSLKLAYPGEPFTYIANDAKCVLCMTTLDAEGRARMERFDSYMSDKTKALADSAKTKMDTAKNLVKNTLIPEPEIFEPLCTELKEIIGTDGGIAEGFKLAARRKEYLNLESKDQQALTYPNDIIDTDLILENLLKLLEDKREELIASTDVTSHEKNLTAKNELEGKYKASLLKTSVETYIANCLHNNKISDAIASLRSTKAKFSAKAKSIISQTVTPEFIKIFEDELEKLGTDIKINISPVVRDSDTSHAFSIGAKKPGKVLSEGEQKVISIAAFLTEVKTYKNTQPIIFDDPVSSLDHLYREKIAARLADESSIRQVAIFTHDISLITEIESKLEEMALEGNPIPSAIFTIKRNGTDSGFVSDKAPWRGMKTPQRAQKLQEELQAIKGLHTSDRSLYNEKCGQIYCLLRESWEALIEQDLFFQVVVRGRNSIQTLKLASVTVEITDAQTIEINMSKASGWMHGHEKSKSLDENRPSPEETLADIEALRLFQKAIVTRRSKVESDKKQALEAVQCEIG